MTQSTGSNGLTKDEFVTDWWQMHWHPSSPSVCEFEPSKLRTPISLATFAAESPQDPCTISEKPARTRATTMIDKNLERRSFKARGTDKCSQSECQVERSVAHSGPAERERRLFVTRAKRLLPEYWRDLPNRMSTILFRCCLWLTLITVTGIHPLLAQQSPGQQREPATAGANAPAAAGKARDLGWLKGKWVFDEEFTEKKYGESKSAEGLTALANGLVYPQLVSKLKGSRIAFKEGEMVMTTADGNGKAYEITVIDPPDADSVTIKDKDGEVTTFHKANERCWMVSTGNVNIPFYFKRAPEQ